MSVFAKALADAAVAKKAKDAATAAVVKKLADSCCFRQKTSPHLGKSGPAPSQVALMGCCWAFSEGTEFYTYTHAYTHTHNINIAHKNSSLQLKVPLPWKETLIYISQ